MHIHKVTVKNFRLLADVEMVLEEQTTLIVGRNNSGKTSLSEVIRRFLVDQNPKFQIEDFSNASYDGFSEALEAKNSGQQDDEVRALIPSIELRLLFQYDQEKLELGLLATLSSTSTPTATKPSSWRAMSCATAPSSRFSPISRQAT